MSHRPDTHVLRLCIDLAKEALDAGDSPFGSVLVDSAGNILHQDRNRIVTGASGHGPPNATLHPELTLSTWAEAHLSREERAQTTVYTSGEHCPMCAAAHAFCGLGRVVYIASSEQYQRWQVEYGARGPVKVQQLPINAVAPGIQVEGPIEGLGEEVKELHRRKWLRDAQ